MNRSKERLRKILQKTDYRCHICRGRLKLDDYGQSVKNAANAWEIEHSVPKSLGGTDRLNNLFAAHKSCNRSKGTKASRTMRTHNGLKRSPMSRKERDRVRNGNMLTMATLGGVVGARAGPVGALIGATIGAIAGSGNPEDE